MTVVILFDQEVDGRIKFMDDLRGNTWRCRLTGHSNFGRTSEVCRGNLLLCTGWTTGRKGSQPNSLREPGTVRGEADVCVGFIPSWEVEPRVGLGDGESASEV